MPRHTGEKQSKCNQCSYASNNSGNLLPHMRSHTGERPFKCGQCLYAATTKAALRVHLRTHTGEKPYKCNHCLYASTISSNLERHVRTHTGEKPYKCTFCSYSGAQFVQLQQHMRHHTDVDCNLDVNNDNPEMPDNLSEAVIDPDAVADRSLSVMSDSDYLLPFNTCLPENGIDFNESLELLYANPGITESINDNFCDIEHAKINAFGFDTGKNIKTEVP